MITFSPIPPVILSRDPFFVDIISDIYKTAEGAYPSLQIDFPDYPPPGATLTIKYNTTQLIFTFVEEPDDSGLQIDISMSDSTPLNIWVSNIVKNAFQHNLFLLSNFNFDTSIEDAIILVGKEKESLSPFSATLYMYGQTFNFYGTSGSAVAYRENFKLNFSLINSDTGKILVKRSFEPNELGKVSVNLSNFLDEISEASFIYPQTTNPLELTNDAHLLKIQAWESYGIDDEATTRQVYTSSYFRVIEGQTSHNEQATRNASGKAWWTKFSETKGFLTKAPTTLKVLASQDVFIKYIEFATNATRYLVIKGNVSAEKIISFSAKVNIPYMFNISPVFLGISDTDQIYQIYVRDGAGNAISEIRYFEIVTDYFEFIREFFFQNSLSGIDSIAGLGVSTVSDEFTRTTAQKVLPRDFTYTDRETKTVQVNMEPVFKVNLGFLQNYGYDLTSLVNYVRQLYASRNVFEKINGMLYPITIENKNQKLMEDGEYLPDWFEVEYKRAFVEKGVPAEIITGGPFNDQFNGQFDGGIDPLYEMPVFDDDKSTLTTTFIATQNFTLTHVINVGKTVYASINTQHSLYRNDELIETFIINKNDNVNGLEIFNIDFADINEATYFKITCKNVDTGTSLKGYSMEFISAKNAGITRLSPIACFGYDFADNAIIDDDINSMLESVNDYANGDGYDANPTIDISGGTNAVPTSALALNTRSAMLSKGYTYLDNL